MTTKELESMLSFNFYKELKDAQKRIKELKKILKQKSLVLYGQEKGDKK